jgi:anaerobic dimethyl sulfoxide reductase subunit B (iron-sulfur subunit)
MTKQYGFFYDISRCVQCRTCEVACKSVRDVELGIHWRWVTDSWCGEFPNVTRTFFSLACMHCAKPACVKVCPTGAIAKRVEDGIVVVDSDKCNGCQECFYACPFDVPQFGKDGTMQKCDFCIETGREPACVASCPAEALRCGTMEELYGFAAGRSA